MRRGLPTAGAAFVLALSCAPTAFAFKEAGHRAIEVEAYRKLLQTPAGAQKLRVLLDRGVLNAPGYPAPLPNQLTDAGFEQYRANALVSLAHMPDHLMDRQLQANRQCFHFNARGAHTTLTDAELQGYAGIPRGLVVDAYVECLGVADSILRGILYDPVQAHDLRTDLYTLIHMVEDSYSDAHVARWGPVAPLADDYEQADPNRNKILFVKPWNLRTWSRYFLSGTSPGPVYHHFSADHHMGSDTRDLGYLVGPTDEDYPRDEAGQKAYNAKYVAACLAAARPLIRPTTAKLAAAPLHIEDLYGDVVPPLACFSNRALAARQAVVDLLQLVADYIPQVAAPSPVPAGLMSPELRTVAPANGRDFEQAWLDYRLKYLGHREKALTIAMEMRSEPDAPGQLPTPVPSEAEAKALWQTSMRADRVAPARKLAPKEFKEAAFGLGVEVRGSTPLWLGVEEFVSRKSANHNRTVVLFDVIGWGLQARLPIENELGERPVGAAFDLGPTLPLPLSELIQLDELQFYLGVRGRIAYTAQAIFESETRHSIELGFGGISADFVIGGQAWLGVDAFRKMYLIDFWDPNNSGWSPLTFAISGGIAVDAF